MFFFFHVYLRVCTSTLVHVKALAFVCGYCAYIFVLKFSRVEFGKGLLCICGDFKAHQNRKNTTCGHGTQQIAHVSVFTYKTCVHRIMSRTPEL